MRRLVRGCLFGNAGPLALADAVFNAIDPRLRKIELLLEAFYFLPLARHHFAEILDLLLLMRERGFDLDEFFVAHAASASPAMAKAAS